MTGLHNTNLTTSQKIKFSSKALASQGEYGSISQLSQDYQTSRPTVYKAQETANKLLSTHFDKSQEQLKAKMIIVDEAQLNRAIIAMNIMSPNSLRAMEDLLPIIYPGISRSFGSIQSLLVEAQGKAKRFSDQVDLSAIENSAVDEMFSQGSPVLAGIDLHSGYLHSLNLCDGRTGEDWKNVLIQSKEQGLDLKVVVKDAAKGIANGVEQVFPDAQQRDDCFHVLYDMNKVRRFIKGQTYGAIENEYLIQKKLDKAGKKKNETQVTELTIIYAQAQEKCKIKIEQFDQFEKAAALIIESMQYVHPETGTIYTGDDVKVMMNKAAELLNEIKHYHCQKLAIYIKNRAQGISYATQALAENLNVLSNDYSQSQISHACLFLRLQDELKKYNVIKRYHSLYQFVLGLYHQLKQIPTERLDNLLNTIRGLLEKRYRASSAIEGFNALLRPYLYLRKRVDQGFLELFKAWHNLRTRRWGRNKGKSAYECISGQKVDDWLTMLGYPQSTPLLH